MSERQAELIRIIAELKRLQDCIDGNLDLTPDDKRSIGGPLSDAIADGQYNLQSVMDERIKGAAI